MSRRLQQKRQARRWAVGFVVLLVLCLGSLTANLLLDELAPYTVWGMGYGIAATVFLLLVIAWAVRRRTVKIATRLRLFSSRTWLHMHVYGGLLFLLLVAMHSGFRLPSGLLTGLLWGLSLWTVLSGFVGLALQNWIPRVLASGLSIEVLYERVPELIVEIRRKAEELCATCEESVQSLYQQHMAATLAGPHRRLIYFVDITGGIQSRLDGFHYLRRFLPAEEKAKLDELEGLFRTKLEIDAHYTLQQALRWWLFLHVPPSLVLLVLVGVHLFTVFYY